MRDHLFSYEPIGAATKVALRVSPPKDDEKARGLLPSKVCRAVDVGTYKGRLRPLYPRGCDPRAELAVPLPSEELRGIVTVRFREKNSERTIAAIEVAYGICANLRGGRKNKLRRGSLDRAELHSDDLERRVALRSNANNRSTADAFLDAILASGAIAIQETRGTEACFRACTGMRGHLA